MAVARNARQHCSSEMTEKRENLIANADLVAHGRIVGQLTCVIQSIREGSIATGLVTI